MDLHDDDDGDGDGGDDDGCEEKSWSRGSDQVPDPEKMDDDVDYKQTVLFIKKQRNQFQTNMIEWKMQLGMYQNLK